jgi:hypothetical protein
LFFSTVLSIAGWVELKCQLDLVLFVGFRWFLDLTCCFWAENGKRKITAKAKAMKSVASPFGLRSGVRQSGWCFLRRAEARYWLAVTGEGDEVVVAFPLVSFDHPTI